jgi:adenylosuccinate synthase
MYGRHKVVTHVVPSGVLSDVPVNLIGPGCVVDPVLLKEEIQGLMRLGVDISTIHISSLVHLITPFERKIDAMMNGAIGTTGKGIGPTYAHKAHRVGIRIEDCLKRGEMKVLPELYLKLSHIYKRSFLDVSQEELDQWNESLAWVLSSVQVIAPDFFFGVHSSVLNILAEGAQATMLDNTFGTYPFVTSSNCLPSAVYSGLGLPGYAKIKEVYGVFKAYNTRVGSGPFSTEIKDEALAEKIRKAGGEYGSTTGRPRRIGWLDLDELAYAVALSGATSLCMTKADVLSCPVVDEGDVQSFSVVDEVLVYHSGGQIARFKPFDVYGMDGGYGLHGSLSEYVSFIDKHLPRTIDIVSVGQGKDDLIVLRADVV